MKKIYSYVLMAMMLLIGTNVWAVYPAGWLQAQFDAVPADGQTHTIVMEYDITLTDPVYLGTATVDEARKSIILDMNGHHITMDADAWRSSHPSVFCHMFIITHGELLVRNNASDKATNPSLIQMTGTGYDNYNDIFTVTGSYKSSRWVKNGEVYVIDESAAKNTRDADGGWFTHLEIGEGVKLVAAYTIAGAGITMDGYHANNKALVSSAEDATGTFGSTGLTVPNNRVGYICLYDRSDAPAYNTALLSGSGDGVAYGLRVDVYGDIEFATAATSGKSYGIKLNGGLRSSLRSPEKFENRYCWAMDAAYARTYGATASTSNELTIDSTSATPALKNAYFNHKLDTIDAPFLYIGKTAHIIASAELNEATAVYCSGYGKTLIEGACSGNSGVNVKSGTVELHDAEITCTATATSVYEAENGNNATGTGAVVVNSVDGRAGGIEVIISGDSKVSTDYGYAIKETVTANNDNTKVTSIVIEGGTIQGGAATETSGGGAIIVSEKTNNNEKAEVVIYGANLTGNNGVEVGGGTLNDLLPKNEQTSQVEGHVTPVVDPLTNKTTLVISAGAPPADANTWADVLAAGEGANVNWEGLEDVCLGCVQADTTLVLGELQINSGTGTAAGERQQLTIKSGATLQVERLVMNAYARIIVEAGGKLIVNGTQGINAPKVENILLMSSESAQAIFLIHPKVSSNRHPNATVQLNSKAYRKANGDYVWQHFGVPSYTDTLKRGDINYDHTATPTAWRKIEHEAWVAFDANEKLKPFVCYGLTTTAASAIGEYQFMCPLMGNEDVTLPLTDNWNYYANSYMAPIDIASILGDLDGDVVEGTMYIYYPETDWWQEINNSSWVFDEDLPRDIDPMQAFVFHRRGAGADPVIDYKDHVYDPITVTSAPARSRNSLNTAMVEIMAADGTTDRVRMIENAQFSTEFDNSYDATKLMNENSFNLFAGENLGIIATDNLEGTALSLNTKEQTSFTMTISHVNGMEYAIRDNLTGTEIAMVEGATYMFSTAANANAEGRFEIVPVAKMPTAIENIEETAAVKGIYTITGQFVGNDYHSLPNGVYVVDGKKIVK